MSTNNKKEKKIRLGKTTEEGYIYSSKIDFRKDFSSQITSYIKERQAYDALNLEIKRLKEVVEKFSSLKKEKNIQYYYKIGKNLLFLDKGLFKKIAPTSILRRIFEELPDILPGIKNVDMATRHLYFMYWIGHIKKNELAQASWDQWFEITKFKFKEIYKNSVLFQQILKECRAGTTGHETLNKKIKILIRKSQIKK